MFSSRRDALKLFAGSAATAIAATALAPLLPRRALARTVDLRVPVYAVKSAELIALEGKPRQYRLSVMGLVPNAGWRAPELVPVAFGLTPDSIWEFRFLAQPSPNDNGWTGAEFPASYTFPSPRDGVDLAPRGVRIRVATGVFSLGFGGRTIDAMEPDAAKCLKPSDDWIGKRLLREGESGAGIKESELCRPYLITTPERIVTDLMYSPARLRLRLDADGIIRGMTAG